MHEFMNIAKEAADQKALEEGEENIRHACVLSFKQKAVGGDTEEFE